MNVTCEGWREVLAMHLLGATSVEETTGLLAHLDGCAACREVATELRTTVARLRDVDPSAIEPTAAVSPALSERVLSDLGRRARDRRRARRWRATSAAMLVAAAALILVAVLSTSSTSRPGERALALRGSASVSATALLVQRSWGTSLELEERGLPGGRVYTVSMESASGRWWTAGTYRSVEGATVHATMACAVAWRTITGVRVVDASGDTVLESGPSTSTPTYQ